MRRVTVVFLAAIIFNFECISAQRILGSLVSRTKNVVGNVMSRDRCQDDHTRNFEKALSAFSTDLFKQAALISGNHFVISPYSIWLSLAAMAEGADEATQLEYFSILNLPKELCVRKDYYRIALSLETPGSDVKLQRKRVLILGKDLKLNPKWMDFVRNTNLLALTRESGNSTDKSQTLKLTGNSLLVDTLDYEGLWTTAFPNADIKRSTFYSDSGKKIGTVDLMTIKQRVRLAYIPVLNAKVLELPVGDKGRYIMLISMGLKSTTVKHLMDLYRSSLILEILDNLKMSLTPIEIAIPKFTVVTKYDSRMILEQIGIKSLWRNPAATRYISVPAPIPSGFIQQVKIKIDSSGINPPPRREATNIISGIFSAASETATGLASAIGRDFIANKPFLYTLIDKKTKTILFTGAFSKPEYHI